MVEGHTALTELSLNKGWISPYDTPIKQLTCSYKESIDAINEKQINNLIKRTLVIGFFLFYIKEGVVLLWRLQ